MVRSVVNDKVGENADAALACLPDEIDEVAKRSEARIDTVIIG